MGAANNTSAAALLVTGVLAVAPGALRRRDTLRRALAPVISPVFPAPPHRMGRIVVVLLLADPSSEQHGAGDGTASVGHGGHFRRPATGPNNLAIASLTTELDARFVNQAEAMQAAT
jgi:hypothetical protein